MFMPEEDFHFVSGVEEEYRSVIKRFIRFIMFAHAIGIGVFLFLPLFLLKIPYFSFVLLHLTNTKVVLFNVVVVLSDVGLEQVFSLIHTPFKARFVEIEWPHEDAKTLVRTVVFNASSAAIPVVLVHGFGAALGVWVRCFEPLASTRPVYAIDLPGFGRSSRPEFSTNAEETEALLVDALERWRKQVKSQKKLIQCWQTQTRHGNWWVDD